MVESRKINIVYTLINKLSAKEKASFNKYLKYYFRKPTIYIDLVKHINKLYLDLDDDSDFPEEKLKALINEPKKFTHYKHKLKASLFSFLRLNFLEEEENKADTQFIKDLLDVNVLYKKNEDFTGYEIAQKMVGPLKESNKYSQIILIQNILIEFSIPYYGMRKAENKFIEIHKDILENVNDYQESVTSRFLKRLMYLKKINTSSENIETVFEQLQALENSSTNVQVKVECLIGMSHYHAIKKDTDAEIKTRIEVGNLLENNDSISLTLMGICFINYRTITLLKEKTIDSNDFSVYLNKMNRLAPKFTNDYWRTQTQLIISLAQMHYTALFVNDSIQIHKALDKYDLKNRFESAVATRLHLKDFNEYEMVCLFIANDFKNCHTQSSSVNHQIAPISNISVLSNCLSSFILFEADFIETEFRSIKRFIKETKNEKFVFLIEFLKAINNFKNGKSSKKVLKRKFDTIIKDNPEEIFRLEKRIINHFFEQVT